MRAGRLATVPGTAKGCQRGQAKGDSSEANSEDLLGMATCAVCLGQPADTFDPELGWVCAACADAAEEDRESSFLDEVIDAGEDE